MVDRFAIAEEPTDRFALADPEISEREQTRDIIVGDMFDNILTDPDKVYDPLRRGQIASELLQSLEEPADIQRDTENRLMLSELFDVPLEEIIFMDKPMLKYMYNDELTSLKDRFQKRPVEGGFFGKMGEALKRGNENVSSDIAMYEAVFEGRGNPQQVLEMRNKQQLDQALTPLEGNWLSDLFYKSGQIVPGMARGYWDAIPEAAAGMVAGAGLTALAGQAGPQIALPEEIITVPAGAAIGLRAGLAAGSAQFWYKQGAGAMVATMLDEGYDPEISRNIAGVAGIPYALIELSQVSKITPGLRKSINTAVNKTVLTVVGKAVKKYGTTLTEEVIEEIGQEIIAIAAEDISGILSDADIPFDKDYIISRSARIWETAKESTKAMALLPVPGMGIDIATGVKSVLPPRQHAEINSKLPVGFDPRFGTPVDEQGKPIEDAAIRADIDVEDRLASLQAEEEAKKKVAGRIPLDPAEREQFPALARQEDQIVRLRTGEIGAIPEAPTEAVPAAPVAEPAPEGQPEGVEGARAEEAAQPIEAEAADKILKKEVFEITQDEFNSIRFDEFSEIEKVLTDEFFQQNPEASFDERGDVSNLPEKEGKQVAAIIEQSDQIKEKEQQLAEKAKAFIKEAGASDIEASQAISNTFNRLDRSDLHEAIVRDAVRLGRDVPADVLADFPDLAKAIPAEAAKPPTLVEKPSAKELPSKTPPVKPVPATKIVSPGEAGPLSITFKATAELPATRIIVDPVVRRSIQAGENRIAELKTKLKQAQADKKVAVIKATQLAIEKKNAQIAKLKERQHIKLADTIEKGKVRVAKLMAAKKFSEALRRDAISMVRAIPKDIQKDFFRRASEVSTLKGLQKLAGEIESGIVRIEKRGAIKDLNKAVKSIKPKKMLPEFAGPAQSIIDSLQLGKLKEDTIIKNTDLKEMAQQVLDSAPRDEQGRIVDSIATFKAQQILDELRGKTAKTFAVNQLSLEAIEQITEVLQTLRFQNQFDTIAAQQENATEAIRRRKLIKEQITEPPKIPDQFGGAAVKKFKLIHDNLESVTDAVGGARPGTYDLWKDRKRALTQFVYDVLDRGVDVQATHGRQAGTIFRQIRDDNNVSTQQMISWLARPGIVGKLKQTLGINIKPETHTFKLEDARGKAKDVEFTANELMSVFMHSRNSHNLAVLLNDGMDRFVKGKKEKIRGFTIEIVDDMIASLTDQQKKVARQVGSKLMDGFNRDAINETSVGLVGFEIAKVDNYWPARRSIIKTLKGEALRPFLSLLENMGILKERVGIGNPLRLIGFFETTHASSRNVATYVGLAGPLREAKAVLSTDVLAEMEDSGREAEAKRILKHVEKIEGQLVPVFETELEEIVARMLGGFAKSKLFLNAKIAPRQQLSAFLVGSYVDLKYMTAFRGASSKALINEIAELSPQMRARIEGFQFDRDIGDAFQQNELLNYLTGDLSLIDKTGLGMRFFDTNAIVDIYRATKAEVIDKNPGIDIKSDEGKALLKDRFEWVVRHSQPVWHVKDRSLLGASRNPLVRTLTMFMSQREQLVRMVNNGISDFANSDKTTADTARLGRVLGTVAMNLAAFSVYNFAWALLIQRRKKDVEELARDFMKDVLSLPFFGKYLAKSFEITFNFQTDRPVFNQQFDDGAVETILNDILIVAAPNFWRAGIHFINGEKYKRPSPLAGQPKWQNELLVATDSLIDALASLKGLPYYGAKDIFKSVKAQVIRDEPRRKPRRLKGR